MNGRGLDLRLRLPDWIDGLDAHVRKAISGVAARGNVTIGLRINRAASDGQAAINATELQRGLDHLAEVQRAATARGMTLRDTSAAEVLSLRGIVETAQIDGDVDALGEALRTDFDALLQAFREMRSAEGEALGQVLAGQVEEVETLTQAARTEAEAARPAQEAQLRTAMARVLDGTEAIEEGRIAQELALLAVKADITEEVDRLGAHVTAARDLLAQTGPCGRKLDFLCQEFNREANTLCSKAPSIALTRIGLDLKATIDQMREQVQNIE